jgi:hypothetical protein
MLNKQLMYAHLLHAYNYLVINYKNSLTLRLADLALIYALHILLHLARLIPLENEDESVNSELEKRLVLSKFRIIVNFKHFQQTLTMLIFFINMIDIYVKLVLFRPLDSAVKNEDK